MSGMGVRIIAFDKGIDNYIIFLEHLFQQLSKNDSSIPNDPSNRIMVGASLSGTACIHIAFEAPKLFHGLIAQSPSPSNDQILMDVKTHQAANIHLSCGFFEQSSFNGTDTDCFKYANILSEKIDLKFNKQDFHGHNHVAWIFDLDQSLPIILQKKSLDDGLSQALSYATITKALTSNKLIALPDAEQERKVVLSEDKIINRTKPTPSLVLSSENDELDNSSQESSSYKI
jgi:predicted alpha/beta hydrolase family esterase